MARVRTSMNIEENILKQLDALIIAPVSRSDVLNALLQYILQQPDMITHLVKCELREIEYRIATSNSPEKISQA